MDETSLRRLCDSVTDTITEDRFVELATALIKAGQPRSGNALDPDKIDLPGVSSKIVVVREGVVGKRDLLVGGLPAPKKFFGKRLITNDAGETFEARLIEGLTGTTLVIGKDKYPVGPQINTFVGCLAFLPLVAVAMGGAIGGFFGALGMLSNRKIAHSNISAPLKIAGMLAVTVLTVLVVLIVAGALHQTLRS